MLRLSVACVRAACALAAANEAALISCSSFCFFLRLLGMTELIMLVNLNFFLKKEVLFFFCCPLESIMFSLTETGYFDGC